MIKIVDKHDCCGCSACAQRCPKGCISMREDAEGFLYPETDSTVCIDCHLCEQVCPWINTPNKRLPDEVLAAKNRDIRERMASSSGGIFIALANKILAGSGVVFGAIFDECWEVRHSSTETADGIRDMLGSKYVQSRMEDSYIRAESYLKKGRYVLFVGTPCQIAGLHTFLRKDYSNLVSVDFLCHGVPSPGVWRKYLEELVSLPSNSCVITKIDFRDKHKEGWKRYNTVVRGKLDNGKPGISELTASVYVENPFMRGFMSDVYLRLSCYKCKCKEGSSHSDLTIADYWGVDAIMPDFDDDKGASLVLVNTPAGKTWIEKLDLDVTHTTVDGLDKYNGGFNSRIKEPSGRRVFFRSMASGKGFSASLDKALRRPFYEAPLLRLKKSIKKRILKMIR